MSTSHISRRTGLLGLGAIGGTVFMGGLLGGGLKASDLVAGEVDRVAAVTSGQTLTLSSGLKVRLAGLSAPRRDDPFGREAQEALSGLVRGRTVRLSYGGDMRDRYDRALAQLHLITPEGEVDFWVQAEMVRLGLARVYTWPDEQIDFAALYNLEHEARSRGRGLWSHEAYQVQGPEPNALAQKVDSLQLVEGIVTSTADVRGRAYLNFGADYRTDFTVAVAKKHRKRFQTYDPVSLEGARIRVRGWIELVNGPMIWASHPARIEVLS
ncbi:MAG: thermonuclease family protein [Pseudomonadota bacterium]